MWNNNQVALKWYKRGNEATSRVNGIFKNSSH